MLFLVLAIISLAILGFVSRSKRKQEIANHDWNDEEDRDTLPSIQVGTDASDLAVSNVLEYYNSIEPYNGPVLEMDDDVEDDEEECCHCCCDCDIDFDEVN